MIIYVGLDIETTGLDPRRHSLCQVGAAIAPDDYYGSDAQPDFHTPLVDPKALEVNGFTHERLQDAPVYSDVDVELVSWLHEAAEDLCRDGKPEFVAVGWNVGSFDMAFIREALPMTHRMFSYRVVDLSSLAFLYGAAAAFRLDNHEQDHFYKEYRKRVKRAANEDQDKYSLNEFYYGPRKEHDAVSDAVAAVVEWNEFVNLTHRPELFNDTVRSLRLVRPL